MATRKAQGRPRRQSGTKIRKDELRTQVLSAIGQTSALAAQITVQIFDTVFDKERETISKSDLNKKKKQISGMLREKIKRSHGIPLTTELYPTQTFGQAQDTWFTRLSNEISAAFDRVLLRASLTPDEKLEILRGMLTTRHLDARLKKFFLSTEVKTPAGAVFQGKGFRSMGQEAIYAAAIRLRRVGPYFSTAKNGISAGEDYSGDYVAPMIRDLGLALAMGQTPYDVMAAQMGKVGKPTQGRDLHIGDLGCGVLPPAAPIALSVGNAAGMGLALEGTGRVVLNCNGEGCASNGEWHEAINFAAVRKMPVVFIVQNNQTALSTPTDEQFAASDLASKAVGYGMRATTIDGTDAEAVFAAVTEATEACRRGDGPVMVELVAMRMCGHAHHDDMLYFGQEPDQFLSYPEGREGGYIDAEKYNFWREKDPIAAYKTQLVSERILTKEALDALDAEVEAEIETAAQEVIAAPWPDPSHAGSPVYAGGSQLHHVDPLAGRTATFPEFGDWHSPEPVGFEADPKGKTFWQAIVEALAEEMERDPKTLIIGEDVGGNYGNAFVILKSLLASFGDRMINTPISEAAIIGAATGAAILGKRPIAEIQFNDFVASGFNQLVNNTAKIFARWGQTVPVTIRLPWGGLRHAGPYHSQNTEPWFYRTPGLKIVCPSTPREAKGLLKAAIRDDNPVLFYEHIALYRAAEIKEALGDKDTLLPIGKAHLKREGTDLVIITYGAYVHRCLKAAEALQQQALSVAVLDLRSLQPLDKQAILAAVKKTNRVLVVHEDSKTGGIGQSVASIIAEEAFEYLDAPVRVLGALDAPVPYSPTLEHAFLISVEQIVESASLLAAY